LGTHYNALTFSSLFLYSYAVPLNIFFKTVLFAFLPVSELRGAIPFAVINGVPWYIAYPFAAAVNVLVAPVWWLFISTLHKLLYGAEKDKGFAWYRSIFDRLVGRARVKLRAGVEKWGWLGVALFIAVPLPLTGAWTGTLGAWILNVSRRKTLAAVVLGVAIAGAIVTALTVAGIEAAGIFIKRMVF
jgi:uncharacterized membrane protein